MPNTHTYSSCKHIKRPVLNITVDKDVVDAIGENYRTLPMFEKGLYEYNFKKHYSLHTHEYLNCRWAAYKRHFEDRVFAPFQFPDIRNYHFYNYDIRLLPSESLHNKKDFRFKLRAGPGVDYRGMIPIPQELLMKRGEIAHRLEKKVEKRE